MQILRRACTILHEGLMAFVGHSFSIFSNINAEIKRLFSQGVLTHTCVHQFRRASPVTEAPRYTPRHLITYRRDYS